ncbi:MAG: HAD family hydrolase [Thermoplasmata archaeon]
MKLFVFDLENTLIYNELLPELAKLVGRKEEVERITRLGVEGQIDWVEGFRQRTRYLAGITRDDVLRSARDLRLVPGALGFVKSLRGKGHGLGFITGGPSELAWEAGNLFGADRTVSNDFIYEDDRFTGEVVVRVTPSTKGTFALRMAEALGVEPRDIVAFADGVMDVGLLEAAGVAVAVNADGRLRGSVNYEVRDFEEAYRWLLADGLI